MSPSDQNVIADFLKEGGRVSRLKESVSVSESELLAYLAARGIVGRYVGGERRAYLCRTKRMSISALIALANQHRSSDALPLFVLKLNPAPSRSRARNYSGAE